MGGQSPLICVILFMGIGTTNQIGNITDIFGKIILESSTMDSLSRSPGHNFHTWPSRNRRVFLLRQVEFLHQFATPTWGRFGPVLQRPSGRCRLLRNLQSRVSTLWLGIPEAPFFGCLGGTWLLHSTNCK